VRFPLLARRRFADDTTSSTSTSTSTSAFSATATAAADERRPRFFGMSLADRQRQAAALLLPCVATRRRPGAEKNGTVFQYKLHKN
jgi:hypothetical protein